MNFMATLAESDPVIESFIQQRKESNLYAESTAGIKRTKPELSQNGHEGSKANNILFKNIGLRDALYRVHGTGIGRTNYETSSITRAPVSGPLVPNQQRNRRPSRVAIPV